MTLDLGLPVAASAWCRAARERQGALGFVPTMGALHAGHLALVRRAKRECGCAVVSVFVNPLQFNDPRDFELYPRDFARDRELLASAGCDACFTGGLFDFFPEAGGQRERIQRVDPGPCARGLEGERRPGHFDGVATIVARLFELVQPSRAYFGEKDFQQTRIVLELAKRLGAPEVEVCATEREASGLALSSRNERLSPAERERALGLSRALFGARAAWRAGQREPDALCAAMRAELERAELRVEYAELRDPERWTAERPRGPLERAQGLVAAYSGAVRLIDTLRLDSAEPRA